MPIKRLRPELVEVGRIRLGYKDPDKVQADRLEQFRFTSPAKHLIDELARLYGGEPRPWRPQNGGPPQFEVFSEANDIPIYLPRQRIDPWLEQWTGAKACTRRCDGEMETLRQVPCICDAEKLPDDSRNRCKPSVRVNLMLAEMPGLQIWSLVSHGFNMCARLAALAPFVAEIPMPVPGRLLVFKRSRNVFDPVEGTTKKRDLIMPEILVDGVTAREWQIGGDALTQAIAAASGQHELEHAPRRAIAAGPAPGPDAGTQPDWIEQINRTTTREELHKLRNRATELGVNDATVRGAYRDRKLLLDSVDEALRQIEAAQDLDTLAGILGALRGTEIVKVNNWVRNSWASKKAAMEAAQQIGGSASGQQAAKPDLEPEPYLGDEEVGYDQVNARIVSVELPNGDVIPIDPDPEVAFPELDDLPQYDAETEFNLIYGLAGSRNWTTAQTNDAIKERCGVARVADATGTQLHQMRVMMEAGQA